MKKSRNKNKKKLLEAKRFVEYFVSGGVWFWSGYILIILLDNHIGLFWANFIGNAVGITLNFLLERYWVFKTKKPAKLGIAAKRYVIYTALNAFLLNYLILQGLINVGIGVEIGQFIASAFFTVWNYFWYKHYVFKGMEAHRKRRRTRHHA
jgi:putative flippase GtrA